MRDYATREDAQRAINERRDDTGLAYTVEEVPEPGSTAAHHVEILRKRVKELEALVEERGKAVTDAHVANHAMHRDLAMALQIGDAMHRAMTTAQGYISGQWGGVNVAMAEWTEYKARLAKAPSVPVGASEAPREGGDSDRRRLEALERWLRVDTYRLVFFASRGVMVAMSDSIGTDDVEAPTLAALADKLAEKEAKP
jgi:hypothetical protein